MAAAGVVAAVGSALGSIFGAFGNQTRNAGTGGPSSPGARIDTSTAAIAQAPDLKRARLAARNADKERMLALVTDPQVIGLATVMGGLLLANNVRFHKDDAANAAIQGVAASGAVLMGLGRAGVGDLTTLAVAAAAGAATTLGGGGASALLDSPLTESALLAAPGGVGVPLILLHRTWDWLDKRGEQQE